MNTTVLPATGELDARLFGGLRRHLGEKRIEHLLVVALLEELDHRLGDDGSDAADGGEFGMRLRGRIRSGFRGLAQRFEAVPKWRASSFAEVSPTCGIPSAIDEAIERDGTARLDRREEVACARLAPALAVCELLQAALVARFERENVLRPRDQALGIEILDALAAETLDVEGVARHEMLQPLARLGRTDKAAGAATHRILLAGSRIDLAHGVAAAGRAEVGNT